MGVRLGISSMAGVPPTRRISVVGTRTLTITLDLEVDGPDVQGSASSPEGAPHAFTGWVGMVAALDALLGADGDVERAAAVPTPATKD